MVQLWTISWNQKDSSIWARRLNTWSSWTAAQTTLNQAKRSVSTTVDFFLFFASYELWSFVKSIIIHIFPFDSHMAIYFSNRNRWKFILVFELQIMDLMNDNWVQLILTQSAFVNGAFLLLYSFCVQQIDFLRRYWKLFGYCFLVSCAHWAQWSWWCQHTSSTI